MAQPQPPLCGLKPRVGLIAAGSKNREGCSSRPSVSEETLGNHVSNVLRRPQVIDRVRAIIRAYDAGMGVEPGG
jgi:DNA-binding NarL/FixJ family response regulator